MKRLLFFCLVSLSLNVSSQEWPARPVKFIVSLNICACASAFCPMVASSTRNVSCGSISPRPFDNALAAARPILPSSSISSLRVWRRPAVSQRITS